MFPDSIIKAYDQGRLKLLLGVLFLALAVPTGAVIWQAYDQLKWESWYQFRNQAQALTEQIDANAAFRVNAAEARRFAEFSFFLNTGPSNVVQRSPLSLLPVPPDVPGVVGFFQIDPDGRFSTPLLPADENDSELMGLDDASLAERAELASRIEDILADNQLIRVPTAPGRQLARKLSLGANAPVTPEPEASATISAESVRLESATESEQVEEPSPATAAESDGLFEQLAFDRLNQEQVLMSPDAAHIADAPAERPVDADTATYGRVQDLRLDEALENRSETAEREDAQLLQDEMNVRPAYDSRARRIETAPAAVVPAGIESVAKEESAIDTFQSEVDPYEFSLLDSGHLVLYRNVWRQGARYIQGLLIEQAGFSNAIIESAFRSSNLADMSNLIVGYHDEIINVLPGRNSETYSLGDAAVDGTLLYRGQLSAPLDSLELIFAINRLPPGPGATVLAWTSIVIAIVFIGGFMALYRLGLSHIRLVRQQQDFVSAVSHELKTPLTSIRMYGEMLKEGWADEQKQRQYFEYIHDESERLTRLISNVLQLSRITRDQVALNPQTRATEILIDQLRSKVSAQVERAGFELEFELADDASRARIVVDEDCFTQVLINLIDNAIKFSRDAEDKRIVVTVTKGTNGHVTIAVRDFGPGIPKDQLKKIFRLFYRTESELTRETVGTGIGLAIVHQLTAAMDGTVDVLNRDPGAEFRLTFPSST